MGFLKPKASKSENVNRGLITDTFRGQMGYAPAATNFMAQLLGVSPGSVAGTADRIGTGANMIAQGGGADAGYQSYLDKAGYAPAMRQLSRNVTGQGAASGMLRSGPTANRLLREGTELNQQYFNNYFQQLGALANQGNTAGQLVAGVGDRSTGGRPSTAGAVASTVGGIASIFSDRRLKTDIEKVDEFEDGLGVYEFRYLGRRDRTRGVMADEVAELRPWALGPIVQGYATVNYGDL